MKYFVLAGALLLLATSSHADQKADDAYARMNARLSAAKSLTGRMVMDQSGSKSTYTFRFLKPNYATITTDGREVHGDGKTNWTYMASSKQYMSEKAQPDQMFMMFPMFGLEAFIRGKGMAAHVGPLTEETFDGKPCNVIALPGEEGYRTFVVQDPQTDLPVGWKAVFPDEDPKAKPMVITAVYKDLTLDEPLEPAAFAWTLPAGSKRYTPPDYNAKLLKVGTKAPDFRLKTHKGATVQLARSLAPKATLVNFWFYG